MNRIYGCLTGVLILSAALSPVYAKDLVAHSGTSESNKEKCISSEQTNNEIEADLQRHLERLKSEDMAKGYLGNEKSFKEVKIHEQNEILSNVKYAYVIK